jgi:hypothetical protein
MAESTWEQVALSVRGHTESLFTLPMLTLPCHSEVSRANAFLGIK